MLSIRTPGAQNLNLGPEVQLRNRKYFQKCPKWSEIPWNLFLSEKCARKVVVVKPEVVVCFGQLLVKSEFVVAESEKGVAAIFLLPVWPLEPPGRSFLPYFGLHCRRIAHRRLEVLSIRKPGAPNLNLWTRCTIQKPEVHSKVPEMVRNVVKFTAIRKTHVKKSSWSNLKWICKTGSSCVLWPTFVQIGNRGRRVKKLGRRHISTSGLTSIARGTPLLAVFWPVWLPYRR